MSPPLATDRIYTFTSNSQDEKRVNENNMNPTLILPRQSIEKSIISILNPFIIFSKFMGLSIHLKHKTSFGYGYILFHFIVILSSLFQMTSMLTVFYSTIGTKEVNDISLLLRLEDFPTIFASIYFIIRRQKIESTYQEIITYVSTLTQDQESTLNCFRKKVRQLIILGLLLITGHFIISIGKTVNLPSSHIAFRIYKNYFGISDLKEEHAQILFCATELQQYVLLSTFFDFTTLFMALTFTLLHQCYQCLNDNVDKLRFLQCTDLHATQQQHQSIGNFVDKINELYSPMILFDVLSRTIQLLFVAHRGLKNLDYFTNDFWALNFEFLFIVSKAGILFFTLSITASKVYSKVSASLIYFITSIGQEDPPASPPQKESVLENNRNVLLLKCLERFFGFSLKKR